MIKTMKQRMEKDEEEGFTLIELLVVVLILGILMAIAIPTFLSLTSSAKTNAAEADLTTATQDEATYFTQNGGYQAAGTAATTGTDAAAATGMYLVDSGINWTSTVVSAADAGQKDVYDSVATVVTSTETASAQTVTLQTTGTDGKGYYVFDNAGTLTYSVVDSGATAPGSSTYTSWASANSSPVTAS